MGSDVAAEVNVGELPLLPPVKTSLSSREKPPAAEAPAEEEKEEGECVTPRSEEHVLKLATVCPPAARNCEVLKETPSEEEEGECVTPRAEEHVLKPATVCPPAPRKPRMAKRAAPATKGFRAAVPRDLTSIFLPLPPKKRIRVG